LRRPLAVFSGIAIASVVLDQATKALVRTSLVPGRSIPVLDGVLHFTYVRNLGAAFGLLPGARTLFIATSFLVLIFVAAFWAKFRPAQWPLVIALALICGGATGNLIDRILLGKVTDFIDFTLINFPVFNVADSAIVIGVGLLAVWLLVAPEEPQAEAVSSPSVDSTSHVDEGGS
jgi:signal peptidase II